MTDHMAIRLPDGISEPTGLGGAAYPQVVEVGIAWLSEITSLKLRFRALTRGCHKSQHDARTLRAS